MKSVLRDRRGAAPFERSSQLPTGNCHVTNNLNTWASRLRSAVRPPARVSRPRNDLDRDAIKSIITSPHDDAAKHNAGALRAVRD